ncbi:MAG: oligosaccharide flippase family protein [Paraglaciecola sp.]|uniref:oligosaccharide flippase family protein n=1 Tax=Paraglaciecola sp. TaxID=1920173 RepID=UPI003296BA54
MHSLRSRLISSSVFMVAAKLFQRSVGLISLLILARLLTPEDFAVVAIVSMVIYFFDVLSSAGSEQYIIQKEELTNGDLNTAWTLDIIIKGALCLTLILSAPLIAAFYSAPDLQNILYVSCLILPISALRNPVLHLLRRQLNYKLIFGLSVWQKLLSFATVMSIVYIEPTYWALIIGDLVAAVVFTIGSYLYNPYRPTLSIERTAVQWGFSKWMLSKNILGYLRSQIDTFFVSKLFDANTLGRFYVARDIVMLPGQNIILPAIQPILAAFRHQQNSTTGIANQLNQTLLVVTSITLPVVAYIAQFPHFIIDTLLGKQWTASYNLMPYLTLLVLYIPYVLLLEQILIIRGKIKFACLFDLFSLLLIMIGLIYIPAENIETFTLIRGGLGIGCTLLLLCTVRFKIPFSIGLFIFWFLVCIADIYLAVHCARLITVYVPEYAFLKLIISSASFLGVYIVTLWLIIILLSPYLQTVKTIKEMIYLCLTQLIPSFDKKTAGSQ